MFLANYITAIAIDKHQYLIFTTEQVEQQQRTEYQPIDRFDFNNFDNMFLKYQLNVLIERECFALNAKTLTEY